MFKDKWLDKGIVLVFALTASLPVMVSYNIVGEELLWYLSAAKRILGVSVDGWYRLFVMVLNLAAAVIAYVSFGSCFLSSAAGVLASGLVVLSPYRLYWLYSQSAVGGSVAVTFVPLILWGVYGICKGNKTGKAHLQNVIRLVVGMLGAVLAGLVEMSARSANAVTAASFRTVGVDSALLLCVLLWIGLRLSGRSAAAKKQTQTQGLSKDTLLYVLTVMVLIFGSWRVNEILMNSGNLMFV